MKTDLLADRHIGIQEEDLPVMLEKIGVKSLDELINKTIPSKIRLKEPLPLAAPMTEREFAEHITELASQNKIYTSYIGMGWYDSITPAVIQRNVFENPVWYTSYTPYQTEVSQGRLEALMNFQTVISDLTAMPLANCSLLDESTAAAEAATMMYGLRTRDQQKSGANVLFVDEEIFPQNLAVIQTRALPQGMKIQVGNYKELAFTPEIFACILQYPNASGSVEDYREFMEKAHAAHCKVAVAESFHNAFHIPTLYTTIVLVIVAAVIVLRKNATVKVLDIVVPIMAVIYFGITIFVILTNLPSIPGVFARIFKEAFGIRQVAAGGFGAVLMNGVKRGLFSNEAGSGSAPCAAAAADCERPAQMGLVQALGVFIDTIVICSCTAMIMLLAPEEKVAGLSGMDLLQTAMEHHLGRFGVVFIAATLFLFSFSTFLGILFYARSNVAYLFGDKWGWQTAYKVLALVMLFIGGIQTYTFVWDLGDVGIGLMTIFNIFILYAMSGQAIKELKNYEETKKKSIEERAYALQEDE